MLMPQQKNQICKRAGGTEEIPRITVSAVTHSCADVCVPPVNRLVLLFPLILSCYLRNLETVCWMRAAVSRRRRRVVAGRKGGKRKGLQAQISDCHPLTLFIPSPSPGPGFCFPDSPPDSPGDVRQRVFPASRCLTVHCGCHNMLFKDS